MEPDPDYFPRTIQNSQKSAKVMLMNLARIFKVEELAESAIEGDETVISSVEPEVVLSLRRESYQLLTLIRAASSYMLLLTVAYAVQAVFCLKWLDIRDFEANLPTKRYADEVYTYSVQFEKMKIVHAATLATISLFVVVFTCRFRTLNQMHYVQLLIISLLVSVLYFVPLIYVAWLSLQEVGSEFEKDAFEEQGHDLASWEKAAFRFADWFYMLTERSDLGSGGLFVSAFVHL